MADRRWHTGTETRWPQFRIDLDNGLAPNRRQGIIWNYADPIHLRINAALWGWVNTIDMLLYSIFHDIDFETDNDVFFLSDSFIIH